MRRSTACRVAALILTTLVLFAGIAAAEEALTNSDVVKMVGAGLSDALVVESIDALAGSFDIRPEALIELRQDGVPESVLQAMVRKTSDSPKRTIPDGTPLVLRLQYEVSSDSAQPGDPVLFEVIEPLSVDGFTVVAAGADVEGTVVAARPRKGFGRRGLLELSIDSVEAVDGQRIPLRNTRSIKGRERYNKAGVITLLFGPFGILVKGDDIKVPAGSEHTIYTDRDWTVELDRQDVGGASEATPPSAG